MYVSVTKTEKEKDNVVAVVVSFVIVILSANKVKVLPGKKSYAFEMN